MSKSKKKQMGVIYKGNRRDFWILDEQMLEYRN